MSRPRPSGPIYVEVAQAGEVLEVRILAVKLAVPVRLDQVVAEKAGQLEELAAARGLTLRVVVTGIPVVTMHPGLADSLVANLLQNALKHSLGGGVIEVTLSAEALVVANAGPVIEGDPARFFERFRKHHAASASPGLGLSIVQQICQHYGFGLRYTFGPAGAIHTLRVDFFQLPNHNTINTLALHKNHRFGQ